MPETKENANPVIDPESIEFFQSPDFAARVKVLQSMLTSGTLPSLDEMATATGIPKLMIVRVVMLYTMETYPDALVKIAAPEGNFVLACRSPLAIAGLTEGILRDFPEAAVSFELMVTKH